MSRYEILPCRLSHIRVLARTLRAEDRAEFEMAGLIVRHRLHALWGMTAAPLAAMIDGEVAAAWGDAGALLSDEGLMWLVTAPPVERIPLAFYREASRDIKARLQYRRALRCCIAGPYTKAMRFFRMLGFTIGDPVMIAGNEYRDIRIERG